MDNYVWQFLIFTGVIADIWLKVRCKQFWSKDTDIASLTYFIIYRMWTMDVYFLFGAHNVDGEECILIMAYIICGVHALCNLYIK